MSITTPILSKSYPATAAMAADDAAILAAKNKLVDAAIETAIEKTTLEEYLNEDESLNDTIDNLTQLLEMTIASSHTLSRPTMFHARRSLVSLETLAATMKGEV